MKERPRRQIFMGSPSVTKPFTGTMKPAGGFVLVLVVAVVIQFSSHPAGAITARATRARGAVD